MLLNEDDMRKLDEAMAYLSQNLDADEQAYMISIEANTIAYAMQGFSSGQDPNADKLCACMGSTLLVLEQLAFFLDAKGQDWRGKMHEKLSTLCAGLSSIDAEEANNATDE